MNLRGHRVRLEPTDAWLARAERATCDPTHALHRLRGFLFLRPEEGDGRTLAEIYADPKVARIDATRSDRWIERLGLTCPRVSSSLLERYFGTWIEHGVLPQPSSHVTQRSPARGRDLDTAIECIFRART
jgi:hypothetical protein